MLPFKKMGCGRFVVGWKAWTAPHPKFTREEKYISLLRHEHPLVAPQVTHFMHVPLRTRVKLPHSPQASPS